jgi:hypothetical protein
MGIVQRGTMSTPVEEKPAIFNSLPPDNDPLFKEYVAQGEDSVSASLELAWENATRDAQAKLHLLRSSGLADDRKLRVDQLIEVRTDLAIAKFDIWAKRNIILVRTDRGIQYYKNWLCNYAGGWMSLYSEKFANFAGIGMLVSALDVRLKQQVEFWEGAAKAIVSDYKHGAGLAPMVATEPSISASRRTSNARRAVRDGGRFRSFDQNRKSTQERQSGDSLKRVHNAGEMLDYGRLQERKR